MPRGEAEPWRSLARATECLVHPPSPQAGWNLGEPLGVSGRSVWAMDVGEGDVVGAESFVCLSGGVGDLDEWQDNIWI